jgi:hypothetical protein
MSPSDHETEHDARFSEFLAAASPRLERSQIESIVGTFMASYATGDVAARVAQFAGTLSFEDPVGHHLASSRTELRQFFDETIATGRSFRFFPERLIVVGDEALQVAKLLIEDGEQDTTLLLMYLHFAFDAEGLITQLRVFYDAGCVSKPI